MKFSDFVTLSLDERLQYFLSTLSVTNRTPEYYVNWNKVRRETKEFGLELNTLNYLIGKDNIYEEAFNLFSKQPDLLRAVPSLIASRDKVLDILSLDEDDNMSFHQLDFKKIDKSDIKVYVDFIEQAGLLLADHLSIMCMV